jgi:imidazolonepropionase-like amidohydrolase
VSSDLRAAHVLVEDGLISAISEAPITSSAAQTIDLRGHTLMPGLIDAHVHAYIADVNPFLSERRPWTYLAHRARHMFEDMLQRGFTTVRDAGGGDWGLHLAIENGLVDGPRLIFCGKALSQTGGHADFRNPLEDELCICPGGHDGKLSWIVDGADAVRHVIREELRRGAHFIKIMGSGGVASLSDRLDTPQFSAEEIRAAVDETERHGTYVTAHIHPDGALRRAVELGVHCIEHGTLISDGTAQLAAERGTSIVPTLSVIVALSTYGAAMGFARQSLEKLAMIEPEALAGVERMQRAGVRMGFGTDLIGELERHQATEFTIRRQILSAVDILRSATSVNAEILRWEDRIGRIAPGFLADLIAVDGNPLEDIGIFDEQGTRVSVVMKEGRIFKNAQA